MSQRQNNTKKPLFSPIEKKQSLNYANDILSQLSSKPLLFPTKE
ncbi:hypothetical protein HMPREF9506_02485 [Enterococcus faecalis TX0309A]|nr:hypothetical protein HMPREF9492_01932 [Enterococcus faecalis DAPTO 512]EFQ13820.1 hypothetical protein HMPREF9504_00681 [Enterococcus faecalis TX0102]EFT41242.1 hypothetical protein HMPREF9496_01701 [Enterococcus faecalis TX4000]EFU87983.1 hypothetical protein HMPREF9507_00481 [Enterococcus faecalis TX0309B]EFU92635.1 hypothetical protein HMPREF9506_02485 [Enterococcus faecalis TX0309A]EJU87792.1 hypothetical protein HMPREF1327_02183 [Enterococcus faecalis 599]EJV26343.1 hypothetical prote